MKYFGNIELENARVLPDLDIGDNRVSVISDTWPVPSHNEPLVINSMSIIPVEGQHLTTFNSEYSCTTASVTDEAKADLSCLRDQLLAFEATDTSHPLVFGNGEVLTPGVYEITGAGSIAGSLTLDGEGDQNALFIIRCSAAFSTGASCVITLVNGASPSNIFWLSVGAVSLGATNAFKGTIVGDAAIAIGDTTDIDGKLFTLSGAISFTNLTISLSTLGVVPAKSLTTFAIFTSLGALTNTGSSTIEGSLGTGGGEITGFATSTVNGDVFTPGNSSFLAQFGVYQDGTVIPNSIRTVSHDTSMAGCLISLHCLTGLLSLGTEAIDVRILVVLGTASFGNRILSSQKFE
jgi:hypothetical protein